MSLSIGLLIAGCAATPAEDRQRAVRPACDLREDCFNQRAIRDFDVLDRTTLVVFVGANRCPYLVELDGFFCDIRMTAFLGFRDFDGRICSLDRSYVAGGPFTRPDEYCRVQAVEPLNDDELLEIYVSRGELDPLPRTGSGNLEVVEAGEDEGATPTDADAGESATADTSSETI